MLLARPGPCHVLTSGFAGDVLRSWPGGGQRGASCQNMAVPVPRCLSGGLGQQVPPHTKSPWELVAQCCQQGRVIPSLSSVFEVFLFIRNIFKIQMHTMKCTISVHGLSFDVSVSPQQGPLGIRLCLWGSKDATEQGFVHRLSAHLHLGDISWGIFSLFCASDFLGITCTVGASNVLT